MRYVISKEQFHNIVYKILDEILESSNLKKDYTVHPSGCDIQIKLKNQEGEKIMSYTHYQPGEDDDGNPHNGLGYLYVNWMIDDRIRTIISIRKSKALDIIADWFSEKFDTDVDDIEVHPKKPSLY